VLLQGERNVPRKDSSAFFLISLQKRTGLKLAIIILYRKDPKVLAGATGENASTATTNDAATARCPSLCHLLSLQPLLRDRQRWRVHTCQSSNGRMASNPIRTDTVGFADMNIVMTVTTTGIRSKLAIRSSGVSHDASEGSAEAEPARRKAQRAQMYMYRGGNNARYQAGTRGIFDDDGHGNDARIRPDGRWLELCIVCTLMTAKSIPGSGPRFQHCRARQSFNNDLQK